MFLDTANVNDIKKALPLGIIQGVTTNPSILQEAQLSETVLLEKLQPDIPKLVFFQVKGESSDEMYSYFLSLAARLDTGFGIKIPITSEGLATIQRIRTSHPEIKILGTVIYTAAQGILASLAGCDYIAPYYNRIMQEGGNSDDIIHKIRNFIDSHHCHTKIMAASFKTPDQVVNALCAGAHTCTLPLSMLEQMLTNKSVAHDLAVFNRCVY